MSKRSNNGRILHLKRTFSPGRPLHITLRVGEGVPNLRRPDVYREFQRILGESRERGLKPICSTLMKDHVHLFALAPSMEVLADAMRYLVSQLARAINRLFQRRGKVFPDRYWSTYCASVKQAWAAFGYILRNPHTARLLERTRRGFDRYTDVDEELLVANRFLRSFLGAPRRLLRELLRRMVTGPVPFVPLGERLQPRLL